MEIAFYNTSNYTLTPFGLAPLLVGVLTALLGLAVLIRERASFVSLAFLLMTWVGAAWQLCSVGSYSAHQELLALHWVKLENAAVVFIPSTVALFSLIITEQFRRFRFLVLGSFILSALFCGIVLGTDGFIRGIHRFPWGYYAQYGSFSFPFLAYFFALALFIIRLYLIEYRRAVTETQRQRLKLLLIAFCIAYLGSADYLAAYGIAVYPIGYMQLFNFLIIAASAIWRYRLVDLTSAIAADQIILTIADPLIVIDREGIIRVANQPVCRLLDRPIHELLGKSIQAVAPGLLGLHGVEAFIHAWGVERYQITLPGPRDTALTLDASVSAIRDTNGEPMGAVWTGRDVTDLTQALSDLKKSNGELKVAQLRLIQAAKMESIGQLAAGVAHEVKNPLAIIQQGLYFLAKPLASHPDSTVGLVLDYAKEAVKRADTVIRGLLDFSSHKELQMYPTNLNAIIEQSLVLVKYELDKAHVILMKELDPQLPTIPLDRNKMEQVFVNIFVNAVQAMPKGGKLLVRTSARKLLESDGVNGNGSTSGLHIGCPIIIAEMEDTGLGIPEEVLPRVFDPFFTTKPAGKGTGLGLAVTKNIIELHGGTVDIRNRPEGGVKVTLTLRVEEVNANGKKEDPRH